MLRVKIVVENFRPLAGQRQFSNKAFTLVELLAVISIALLVMSLVVPSIDSMMSGGGRKGATVMTMNLFEQARATAIQSGEETYVGFADRNTFGNKDPRAYRAMIVFRRYNSDIDAAPASGSQAPEFVALTKWYELPKNVAFKSNLPSVFSAGSTVAIATTDKFPMLSAATSLPVVKWNATGMIETPTPSAGNSFIYEGAYNGTSDEPRRASSLFSGAGATNEAFYDQIAFSRFTGRARLNVATFQ